MTIRQIDTSHAAELSALAKAIYVEHYLHLWYPGGAEWYMNEQAYPAEKLQAELADPNNLHYIVYDELNAPLGYLKLRIIATLSGQEEKDCLEIERIYLHKAATGKGVGRQLMELSETVAKQYHKDMVFLKAMDSSQDAIGFYQRMGYKVCGKLVLPFAQMKEVYRGMVILQKTL
ncbi:MAG TPA: GNAT family N-acetyltransferase [Sediminibacterium sp.]